MAKDWIKMRMDLSSHPKVVRILSATKSDKFQVVGGLHAVWSVFDIHSEHGALHGYTPDTMDHVIGWKGFSDAMIRVGWLAYDGAETLTMPDFDTHNGNSAKRRADETERKRKAREKPEEVRTSCGQVADEMRSREEESRGDKDKPPIVPQGDRVPYKEIFDLYHKILPELPPAPNQTEKRKKNIAQRWKETAKVPAKGGFQEFSCNDLDFWERFFGRVRNSPLLMGENDRGWQANLEWITKKENFYKIIEGNYVK